jgi:pimeloyl-ACP methyl ester carboxylesterase
VSAVQAGAATLIRTRRGALVRVLSFGAESAPPLVFMHGVMGLLDDTRFLEKLAERFHVLAPELPGYGLSEGEELLEDMLDFTLHGFDVLDAVQVQKPILVGHSLGGMIAAEMACLAPTLIDRLILVNPFGVWLDERPIPDLFALLPFEFGDLLFHDQRQAAELLPGASDVADPESLRQFFVANTRQLGTAGKLLFPIPNRRLSKRLYRLSAPTLLVWAADDRLIPASAYTARWQSLVPQSQVIEISEAGHMLPYEQPLALAEAVSAFIPISAVHSG